MVTATSIDEVMDGMYDRYDEAATDAKSDKKKMDLLNLDTGKIANYVKLTESFCKPLISF